MKNPQPRPASSDDLTKVCAIEQMSNRPPWSEAAFSAELEKKGSHFWVMTDEETDEIVFAYIVFSFLGEQAHIQTLGVDRKYRKKGFAKQLLRAVISFVARKKGESIYLELRKSNNPALQLYQGLGFVVLRTVPRLYPDGEDGYTMIFKIEQEKIKPSQVPNDSDALDPYEEDDEEWIAVDSSWKKGKPSGNSGIES